MKLNLSEDGSIEMGLGVMLVVAAGPYYVFAGREFAILESGLIVSAGLTLFFDGL